MSVLVWVLIAYGVTMLVTISKIAEPLRRRIPTAFARKLVSCPMCFGFWVGIGLSLSGVGIAPAPSLSHLSPLARVLMDGAAASASSWILHVALAKMGALDH